MEHKHQERQSIYLARRSRRSGSSQLPLLGDDEQKKLERTQLCTRLHNLKINHTLYPLFHA